jgi:oxygen-independent coproporphyrinogen III oxidase
MSQHLQIAALPNDRRSLAACASKTASAAEALRLTDLPRQAVPGLYVHVPFCRHKCHYCDFYSITRQELPRLEQFVDLVIAEAREWAEAGRNDGPVVHPRTVFFGGGTPTLLPMAAMARLLSGLGAVFDLSAVEEWTVEANPATVDAEYCRMLRGHGVDRISFGAQSFDKNDLKVLERHHEPDDVPAGIAAARAGGFSRINIDLIYAVPGQTMDSWARTLETAIELGLDHHSCYGLTYEPNTALAVRRRLGQFVAAEESLELAMFRHTRRRLSEAGMPAYEISNFARPGQACRHNLLYWTGGNYAGLGPSAASHVGGVRFANRRHLGEWERAVSAGQLAASEIEHLSPRQRAGELVMLMLRLPRGIDFDDYAERTGCDARTLFADELDRLSGAGVLAVDGEGFRLTDAGLAVADAVSAEFLGG